MGDGPKRSPLHRKGPKMGYYLKDSFGYSPNKDEVFASTNNITLEQELVHSHDFRQRRHDDGYVESNRTPVYVPCNIPRWCSWSEVDQGGEKVEQSRYNSDRYIDLSTRDNQGLVPLANHSTDTWLQNQSPMVSSPCHYVDLDLSTSREPVGHIKGQWVHSDMRGCLPKGVPCQYAELDFEACRIGASKYTQQNKTATQLQSVNSYGIPEVVSVDYGFPARPSVSEDNISHESVGCQADLDDNAGIYVYQDNVGNESSQEVLPMWGFASPYSDIPVYRRAYDQFRSPASSPHKSYPSTVIQEQLKPYKEAREAFSPRRQKGKKHRVSFKVMFKCC